jgi:hypothetical protein
MVFFRVREQEKGELMAVVLSPDLISEMTAGTFP